MKTSIETLGRETAGLQADAVGWLLLGQRVRIGVSEPWDFEGPDKDGAIMGTIIDAGQGEPSNPDTQWLLLETTPFDSEEGVEISHLRAGTRYAGEAPIVVQVANGARATVNLSYGDQVPENKRLANVVPKLIGNIQLTTNY